MKIAIGADHAGFELKESLRAQLRQAGYEVVDRGTDSTESVDYPDFAAKVALDVAADRADRGILICSTGVGMSMAANKIDGIRAALGTIPDEVRLTRQHNDANVLTLGARYLDAPKAMELVNVFLETEFEGGRHERRVDKIMDLEESGY